MSQLSFASMTRKNKTLKANSFLDEMDKVIPWKRIKKIIKPHYYSGTSGRKPMDLELMLRIYFLQQWFNLSDPAAEEAIYDRYSFQRFLQLDVLNDLVPDETTILKFRHLLEKNNLMKQILDKVNQHLIKEGIMVKEGTIVDATIISAPSSTKNQDRKRDPEMSSTRKNGQWYYGMKVHTGVDAKSGLIHTLEGTTAKVNDNEMLGYLLHGEEAAVFGDRGYCTDTDKHFARQSGIFWGVPDKRKPNEELSTRQKKRNKRLRSIRSKVEYPFQVMKNLWGHAKARYKGIYKNTCQFLTLALLHNMYKIRKNSPLCWSC